MKSPNAALLAGWLLVPCIAAPALAAAQESPGDLERAEATFRAIDTSSDGNLSTRELTAATVPLSSIPRFDRDGDGAWSRDEFLLYYGNLLDRAGRGISPALRREVDRARKAIDQAERRRQAEREKARAENSAGENSGEGVVPGDAGREQGLRDRLERAEGAAADRLKRGGADRETFERTRDRLEERARAAAGRGGEGARADGVEARLARARALLESRAQRAKQARGEAGAGSASEGGGTVAPAGRNARLRKDLERAEKALADRAGRGGMSPEEGRRIQGELEERARAAGGGPAAGDTEALSPRRRLERALDALAERAKRGEMTREQVARIEQDLLDRARAAFGTDPLPAAPAEWTTRRKLERALDALEERARSGGMTRVEFERIAGELAQRARGAEAPVSDSPTAGEVGRASLREREARAEAALQERAARGGMTRQEYERIEGELRARARAAAGGKDALDRLPDERRQKLERAISALAERAVKGGWSREQYEREREALIERARAQAADSAGSETQGGTSSADASGASEVPGARGASAAGEVRRAKEVRRPRSASGASREAPNADAGQTKEPVEKAGAEKPKPAPPNSGQGNQGESDGKVNRDGAGGAGGKGPAAKPAKPGATGKPARGSSGSASGKAGQEAAKKDRPAKPTGKDSSGRDRASSSGGTKGL